jgi:hypothetical protein
VNVVELNCAWIGGMKVFGLLGIVLGPLVLAITIGLLNTFKVSAEELETETIMLKPSLDESISANRTTIRIEAKSA